MRYALDDTGTVHFELSAGDRVRVEERQNAWLLVSTTDGQRGWTEAAAMTLVGPPYTPAPSVTAGTPKTGGAE